MANLEYPERPKEKTAPGKDQKSTKSIDTMSVLPSHKGAIGQLLAELRQDKFGLIIGENAEKLKLPTRKKLMLGRRATSQPEDDDFLDLTPYRALDYGVSRQHAYIGYYDESYVLTDLGSTNGTYLGEKRLTPYAWYSVKSGDQFRLGNLYISIVFKDDQHEEPRYSVLTLHDPIETQDVFSLVRQRVTPFIDALTDLQQLIMTSSPDSSQDAVSVHAMNVEVGVIRLEIAGADEAIDMFHRLISTFLKENPGKREFSSQTSAEAAKMFINFVDLAELDQTLLEKSLHQEFFEIVSRMANTRLLLEEQQVAI